MAILVIDGFLMFITPWVGVKQAGTFTSAGSCTHSGPEISRDYHAESPEFLPLIQAKPLVLLDI
jgi:hypothetical protein